MKFNHMQIENKVSLFLAYTDMTEISYIVH